METKNKKQYIGKVISNKMEKTIVVEVEGMKMHKLYKKSVRHSKRIKSHDDKNECGIGDVVKIVETRPLSKDKRFRLLEVIQKAK
ncbi:MAG TPA: 30S ribosomal protein S17 [Spirochaetota bacterium]|jgi:small subunit ribosomal protein S17|nr:30S ribosomal protein S17 [Spirochaetota bacterium]HQP48053.1 30S ribosomal protein S17 [Spirochaetota bacterium]